MKKHISNDSINIGLNDILINYLEAKIKKDI